MQETTNPAANPLGNPTPPTPAATATAATNTTPAPQAAPPQGTANMAHSAPLSAAFQPPPLPGQPYATPVKKERQPFTAKRADAWFALACIVLGYLFLQFVFFFWQGWGVSVFTVLFAGATLVYARAKGHTPGRNSWYWLGVLLLTGLSFALWPGGELAVWRSLLLVGSAVYWAACLCGVLMEGKTGNYLPMDLINLLFLVPFRNFGAMFLSFKGFKSHEDDDAAKTKHKRVGAVVLGVALCVPLLAMLLPMLQSADGGYFTDLTRSLSEGIRHFFLKFEVYRWLSPMILFLTVPVSLYLCGLLAGLVHKRYTSNLDHKKQAQRLGALRVVPVTTSAIVLGGVTLVYLVFIGCQVPYFFSAFAGLRPETYQLYSEYARDGFFELCRIATINAGLMAVVGTLCRKSYRDSLPLRVLNLVLSGVTLLLLATALRKMLLYIEVHGYTQKRIMTIVFMAFMAGVFVAVILLQFRRFSVVRVAAVYGSALLCALCLCNLDGLVMRGNAARVAAGTLPDFQPVLIARSGLAGLPASVEIFESGIWEEDSNQWQEAQRYIRSLQWEATANLGENWDTVAAATARDLEPIEDEDSDNYRH